MISTSNGREHVIASFGIHLVDAFNAPFPKALKTLDHLPGSKDDYCNVPVEWLRSIKKDKESRFQLEERVRGKDGKGKHSSCCETDYVKEDYRLANALVSDCLHELPKPPKLADS